MWCRKHLRACNYCSVSRGKTHLLFFLLIVIVIIVFISFFLLLKVLLIALIISLLILQLTEPSVAPSRPLTGSRTVNPCPLVEGCCIKIVARTSASRGSSNQGSSFLDPAITSDWLDGGASHTARAPVDRTRISGRVLQAAQVPATHLLEIVARDPGQRLAETSCPLGRPRLPSVAPMLPRRFYRAGLSYIRPCGAGARHFTSISATSCLQARALPPVDGSSARRMSKGCPANNGLASVQECKQRAGEPGIDIHIQLCQNEQGSLGDNCCHRHNRATVQKRCSSRKSMCRQHRPHKPYLRKSARSVVSQQ